MKRVFFVTSLIAITLIIIFSIPVTQTNEILLEANFYNVLEQLNYPSNWIKWQPSLQQVFYKGSAVGRIKDDTARRYFSIEIPEQSYYVKKTIPLTFEVEDKTKKALSVYRITVVSTRLPNKTNMVISRRISLFNYFFSSNKKIAAYGTAYNLKAFLENPSKYYGYPLRIESVVDTTVVVTKKTVSAKNRLQQLSGMYKDLAAFIYANDLTVLQPRIASMKMISNDSTVIMAGIPVNKAIRANGYIECLKMPKGRMLVGEYEGVYSKRASLLNAMEKYIRDHMMVSVAVPYEKYLNDSIPATDTSSVKLKMYYPIL
jgi:effector-binding domain-containing protein